MAHGVDFAPQHEQTSTLEPETTDLAREITSVKPEAAAADSREPGLGAGLGEARLRDGRPGSRQPREASGSDDQAAARLVSQAVKRAQAGDRDALGFLYARYADDIYGYVRSIVHDYHEAEDVTQHVFAKLMRVIGTYQERDVPFFAWMLRVARNAAVDHIRQRRLVPVEEVRGAESEYSVGHSHHERPINELRDALATLPLAQREVLVLRHFAGLSPTEIATRTGKSEGSIHGLHHRGRRALRAELISREAAPATISRHGAGARITRDFSHPRHRRFSHS
ncbi:MAG TPA: sigma-70 family RNA polymerase sigma factor [Solirubrobacteraceae bacterium]|nr:sigma-70 family RNA polymerase sigma factor [Solirubrobacteraceae bacterium]